MSRLLFTALLALSVCFPVVAQEGPDALVRSVTQEVLTIVRADKEIQAGNTKKTIALVEEKVLPHFDFTRMTALAMGPNWRRATPEQQKQLVEQFRTLLVRTYSSALSQYRDQTIEFRPARMQPDGTEAMVRSEIRQSGTQPITIDYAMEKSAAGWKVYDVSVAGVSLVTTYRDSFANEIRNAGVDGLIKTLAERNRQLETKSS